MFVTDFTISRSGDKLGVLRLNKEGFSIPNLPELMELISQIAINGHKIDIVQSEDRAVIRIVPHDLTRNMALMAIQRRLKYTEFVLDTFR